MLININENYFYNQESILCDGKTLITRGNRNANIHVCICNGPFQWQ